MSSAVTSSDPQPYPESDDISSNPSSNRLFQDVVATRLSRRTALTGGVVAAAGFLGAGVAGPGTAAAAGARHRRRLLNFPAVPISSADTLTVADGYTAEVLIPWGTPIRANGPAWRRDASNSAADQARQIGMGHDGMQYFPLGPDRGLLVLNHEYADQVLLFPDGDAVMTPEKVAKSLAAHGVSVVEIALRRGRWQLVDSRYNRRITTDTPVRFSGPLSGNHPALQTGAEPRGTLNNCSCGATPWGTYLTCEENFNEYFATEDPTWEPTPEQARYGVTRWGYGYRWHHGNPRFDLAATPNEPNRFGWVVEIDPRDPNSKPVKRTALGRIKHETATVTESRGRVVVYTGDDQVGEYIYKFVSSGRWRTMRATGRHPLDHGTLYVARFDDDGTGRWLPLKHGTGPLTTANGWRDQADVLLRTRQAADAVGATPMDRPEWIAVHPNTNDVYVTLSNGTGFPNAANPRRPNPFGHIVRWRERHADATATSFEWDIFLLAGDPEFDPSVPLDATSKFGSPDGLAIDRDGRMWIQSDISNSSLSNPQTYYVYLGNNALLAADPVTGEVRRFAVGPRGCELSGIAFTPDHRTMFINVQHPGEAVPTLERPSPANPQSVSSWPDRDPKGRPRSATVAIRRRDGGVIGR
ncbi:PhoX family phosphatase [Micromonospora gifhornensis]|uniref:Tat pathway signal protein n=1 Tax=Micromonospora gifhornensis TaxID=84594 RepID=A0ABQ4IBC5_9ACTN|nr:PhoX family phosphatase [Micromonospora gifhornensis]GIJ15179.1 Tat pathway signal protein [Micromonospora gifhornensis]